MQCYNNLRFTDSKYVQFSDDVVPHPTATEIVKSMIKKIKITLTPAQKKNRDHLLANNASFS